MCTQSPHKSCVTNCRSRETQVLKLEIGVCGLRNAPRAWWNRVVRDLDNYWVGSTSVGSVSIHAHEWY